MLGESKRNYSRLHAFNLCSHDCFFSCRPRPRPRPSPPPSFPIILFLVLLMPVLLAFIFLIFTIIVVVLLILSVSSYASHLTAHLTSCLAYLFFYFRSSLFAIFSVLVLFILLTYVDFLVYCRKGDGANTGMRLVLFRPGQSGDWRETIFSLLGSFADVAGKTFADWKLYTHGLSQILMLYIISSRYC